MKPHWTTLLLASSIPLGVIGVLLLIKYGWALQALCIHT